MSTLAFVSLVLFCVWAPDLLLAIYLISPWHTDRE
jgi:hypothetical protein